MIHMKKYTAIIAALVIAVILVSGCTLPTTNNTTTTTGAGHDAFLERYVNETRTYFLSKDYNLKAWDVSWHNATTVNVVFVLQNKSTGTTDNVNRTIMRFPSTSDATAYFNSLNRTGYVLSENIYTEGAYLIATGHSPTIYKVYDKGTYLNNTLETIAQTDDLVATTKYIKIS
jgi:hypothetical protein